MSKQEATRLADALDMALCDRELSTLLDRTVALLRQWPDGTPVAHVTVGQLSKMFEDLEGIDTGQPGYHWRKGWNAALRRAMDYAAPADRIEADTDELTRLRTKVAELEATLGQAREALEQIHHARTGRTERMAWDAIQAIHKVQS